MYLQAYCCNVCVIYWWKIKSIAPFLYSNFNVMKINLHIVSCPSAVVQLTKINNLLQ